jgi:uncharacterized protein YdeI (YjbR/CyaY-like superfamily)
MEQNNIPGKQELPIISFELTESWKHWLAQNHSTSTGVWLRFYKKASGKLTITYAQALDEALCYGWIDGQTKIFDKESYLQKFTPRRSKSIWSKKNIEHINRLVKEGRMQQAGIRQAEAAKSDGRWAKAYDSPANMTFPEDFMSELSKNKKALAFFQSLNKANKYAIGWRLQTAKKTETRLKRMKIILVMMAKGEKFH